MDGKVRVSKGAQSMRRSAKIPMHRNKVKCSMTCKGYLCPVIGNDYEAVGGVKQFWVFVRETVL